MSHRSLAYTFITKTFWIYCLTFIALPAGYFNKIIISADLSVAEVGVLYSIINLFGIIVMYNDLGFKESMIYFLPKFLAENKKDSVKSTLIHMVIIQIITSILISIGLYLSSDWLALIYFKYPHASIVLQMMTIYLILQCLNPDSIFLIFQDAFWHKLLNTLNLVGVLGCTLMVHFFAYHTIKRFAVGYILIGCLLIIIGTGVLWQKHLKSLWYQANYYRNKDELGSIFRYSLGVLISNNLLLLIGSIDLLLIMGLLGPVDAGYYSNYVTIVGIIPALVGPIFSIVMPLTSQLYAQKKYTSVQQINSVLSNYFLVGACVCMGFGVIFGPEIAIALLGSKFEYSGQIAQIGFLGLPLSIAIRIIFVMFASTGVVMSRIKILGIGVVVNIVLIWLAIMLGGGTKGVAMAVVFTWTLLYILTWNKIDPKLKPKIDLPWILYNIIIGFGIAIIFSWIWKDMIQGFNRWEMFWSMIGLGLGYLCIVGLFNYNRIVKGIQTLKNILYQS